MEQTEIYIEQSCDIDEFEKEINKKLKDLLIEREVISFQYKTGFAYEINGKTANWYSMAILHKKRESYEIDKITKRIDENLECINSKEKEINCLKKEIERLEKKINRQTVEINKIINIEMNREIEKSLKEEAEKLSRKKRATQKDTKKK